MLAGYDVRLVEKDCLPNAAQSVEDKASSGLAGANTFVRNLEIFDLGIPPDLTRAGVRPPSRLGVLVRIHCSKAVKKGL